MKKILAFVFAITTFSIYAQETQELLRRKFLEVTVNISKAYAELYMVNSENGDIDHFEYEIHHTEKPTETGTFSVEDIQNGTVFKEGLPKKFVTVNGDNFSAVYGGDITIRYPSNVLTGSYNSESFSMDRQGEQWPVNHASVEDFKKVHVNVKKVFGIPVGAQKFKYIK